MANRLDHPPHSPALPAEEREERPRKREVVLHRILSRLVVGGPRRLDPPDIEKGDGPALERLRLVCCLAGS